MTEQAKHTPGPWRFLEAPYSAGHQGTHRVYGPEPSGMGEKVILSIWDIAPEDKANAEHIVRCVNAHDDLVRAAQRALNVLKTQGESVRPGSVLGALAAALAKAGAK